ncbi:MAG TPA: dephospho-CoA kinase [Firmicutes bacterium]|nr:dephospho-CoA kinase [Bacillota bacterium]
MIGITGGIASGKTVVADRLRALGYAVLDADQYAREAIEPHTPGWEQVRRAFPQVVGASGRVDRAQLAALVFADAEQRKKLERIIHPFVITRLKREAKRLKQLGEPVFAEVPLLYEAGLESLMSEVWVVYADRPTQLGRLMRRAKISLELAEAMLASQMPLAEKKKRATRVIDNNGSLADTWAQLDLILQEVRSENCPHRP